MSSTNVPVDLRIAWDRECLTVRGAGLPAEVRVWYIEAFCRPGAAEQRWPATVIPHQTELVQAREDGRELHLRSLLPVPNGWAAMPDPPPAKPFVVVDHVIQARGDHVVFEVTARNEGAQPLPLHWAQPCVEVAPFTGRAQEEYIARCFIFLDDGARTLDRTRRSYVFESDYQGGQVYAPAGADRRDVGRPLSPDVPAKGLIGCFSADDRLLLAVAWEPCHALFQGVRTCIHADLQLGGLAPGEVKRARGILYVLPNDLEALQRRYDADFPPR